MKVPAEISAPCTGPARCRLMIQPMGRPKTALVTAFDALDPADWDVADLAAALGPDPDAAFALVRDRIGLDAYAGSLRGAEGTLSARGGNAVDRALLLQALLAARLRSRARIGSRPCAQRRNIGR